MGMWKSFISFLPKFSSILDMYDLLKNISKQKFKFRNEPWTTVDLQKSNSIKSNYIKT